MVVNKKDKKKGGEKEKEKEHDKKKGGIMNKILYLLTASATISLVPSYLFCFCFVLLMLSFDEVAVRRIRKKRLPRRFPLQRLMLLRLDLRPHLLLPPSLLLPPPPTLPPTPTRHHLHQFTPRE